MLLPQVDHLPADQQQQEVHQWEVHPWLDLQLEVRP